MHEIITLDEWNNLFRGMSEKEKVFTREELESFPGKTNAGSLAGRYLIKMLIFKYLKIKGDMNQVEILNDELGKPVLKLSDFMKQRCDERDIHTIHCSISHSRKRIVGMIVVEPVVR